MEFQKEPGRIIALGEDGKLLAEITFPTGEDGVADIDHTFVDESLRGQGVASQLVRAAAAELRAQGKRAKTSEKYCAGIFCSIYDNRIFYDAVTLTVNRGRKKYGSYQGKLSSVSVC